MHKLLQGVRHFQANVFASRRELFESLAQGQHPQALFITCSDSRIDPNLITQTGPGDLFVLRNAGNIVPPHGAANGGEGAAIEYAVQALGVKDIIVCGHSLCGAMRGLLDPGQVSALPAVSDWLRHAEPVRRIVRRKHRDGSGPALLAAAVEENVLVQLQNLRTHPAVAAGVDRGEVQLHGWVYRIETGEIFAHDPRRGEFVPLTGWPAGPTPPPAQVAVQAG
jgi:carbonic anhydrase